MVSGSVSNSFWQYCGLVVQLMAPAAIALSKSAPLGLFTHMRVEVSIYTRWK
jgi:hypothetical protein